MKSASWNKVHLRTTSLILGFTLCLSLGLASSTPSASALWHHGTTLKPALATGTLATPTNLNCVNNYQLIAGSIKLTWSAVPGATSYWLYMHGTSSAASTAVKIGDTTTTEFVVVTGLVPGLLSIIGNLLSPNSLIFTVEARAGDNWYSPRSTGYQARPVIILALPPSLSGLSCHEPVP